MKNNILELETNKLKAMCINETMSDSEKGEIVHNYMALFNLTQKQVSEKIGIFSQTLSRWYLSYIRMNKLDEEIKNLAKDETDRTKLLLLRLEEPNIKKKQLFFLKYKKGLSTSQQERLVSILNGKSTVEKWSYTESMKYKKIKNLINMIKREMLLIPIIKQGE